MSKYLQFNLSFLFLMACLNAQETQVVKMPKRHMAFIDQYCMECHDSDTEKGDFNIEDLPFEIKTIKTAEMWKHVLNSINAGEMPPEDKTQPKAKEKADFLNDLSEVMVEARSALSDSGGIITMRRLNRREYTNSIKDLLGVDVDAGDLPDDQSAFGFDTSGKSLFFSSDQFDQYLKLGEKALDKVLSLPESKPEVKKQTIEVEDSIYKFVMKRQQRQMDIYERIMTWKANRHEPPSKYGFIDEDRINFELRVYNQNAHNNARYMTLPKVMDGAYLCLFHPVQNVGTSLSKKLESGRYVLKVTAGLLDQDSPTQFLEFGTGKAQNFSVISSHKVKTSINKPSVIEIPIDHQKGDDVFYNVRLRVPNNNQNVKRLFFDKVRRTGLGHKPNIWIDKIEVEGPFYDQWPPQNYVKLFPDSENKLRNQAYARKVLESFATRAFRGKPVSEDYLDGLVKIFANEKNKKMDFENAIKKPLAIILSSPSFLYLSEPTNVKPKARPLDDRELAVRLSYFLWSSPPDEILMNLVENKQLKNPKVLQKQVQRMLMDEKSYTFISAFCHQWLHMERLDFFQFNTQKYTDFDESAKYSARHEIYKTFEVIMKEKLGLDKLLKADFVVIDELLASYYGIDGVKEEGFHKVKLESDSQRGGLLSTAAVLAMGSDGENSSPVERGAWILRKLLNDPPPPAPPNVPQLGEVGEGMSKREMLSAHTKEPQCAQCHRKIDPLGFGLENFNAAGKWVEHELVREKVIDKAKSSKKKTKYKTQFQKHIIDASGKFYKGPSFKNFIELRDAIAKRKVDFATGFVEHLIEYALGRPYGFTDDALSERIVQDAKQNGYRIDRMIQLLVASQEFQSK